MLLAAVTLVGAGCTRARPLEPSSLFSPDPNAVVQGGDPLPDVEGSQVAAIATEDGAGIVGLTFNPGQERAVILLHASGEDLRAWLGFAQRLAAEGYTALAVNFRGYGQSSGTRDPALYPTDVQGAVSYLYDAGARHIVVVGREVGGTAAVPAGWLPNVDGVVAIAAPPVFQSLDVRDRVDGYPVDVMVITDGQDGGQDLAAIVPDSELHPIPETDENLESLILQFVADVTDPGAPRPTGG